MKKQSKNKKNNQIVREYFIPLMKNKLQRAHFSINVRQWVQQKFNGISKTNSQEFVCHQDSQMVFKEKCKTIQSQFQLKYSIESLVAHFPVQYYQTLIHYVMQKKLSWTFKLESPSQQANSISQKEQEIDMVLQLKSYYTNYEYQQNYSRQSSPRRPNHSPDRQPPTDTSFIKHRNTVVSSFKKSSFDFNYDLLMMFSVCVVASFFQSFFTELQIDNNFKAEIYVIINHVFLDLEVSPNVFDIMMKKYCHNFNQRNYKSLNASYVHDISMVQQKKTQNKPQNQLESKRTIGEDKLKSTLTLGRQTMTKISRGQSKEHDLKRMQSTVFNNFSLKGLNSTIGFSSQSLKKGINKKDLLIKATTSIGNCLPSERQFRKDAKLNTHENMNCSRFNSFIKDTKQMSMPPMLEEALGHGYLPTDQEIQFYRTVKKCLHVDSLPPIMKKKMNMKQYQKFNEVDKIKEIRKEVKEIDQNSKKVHIKSNDISLAMNTFISFSCEYPKNKPNEKSGPIIIQSQKDDKKQKNLGHRRKNNLSLIDSEQKENFELRKLPVKAANLRFQLHRSSNNYAFNAEAPNIDFKTELKQNLQKNNSKKLLSTRKTHQPEKYTEEESQRTKQQLLNFQQKTKKSTTQWNQFIQTLKTGHNKDQIMTMRQNDRKVEKKRQIERQVRLRQRQTDFQINQSNYVIGSALSMQQTSTQINLQNFRGKDSTQFLQLPNQRDSHQRQSIIGDLSSKLQLYEVQTKEITQIDLVNENTNRNDESSKYACLQSQVNVHKDVSMNYKSLYKSFDLKKKLNDFESNCKKRDEKANYSIFNIKIYKDPLQIGAKEEVEEFVEEQQEQQSSGKISQVKI